MSNTDSNRGVSRHGLTAGKGGWYRRVAGITRYICSYGRAPTAAEADEVFRLKFADLAAPRQRRDAITLAYVCDAFEDAKSPRIAVRSMRDYRQILTAFMRFVGKNTLIDAIGPEDFTAFAATFRDQSIYRREKFVVCVRCLFNFAIGQGWLGSVRYGPVFVQPTSKEKRIAAATRPRRFYTAVELRQMAGGAEPMLSAAIYLAINGGLGNTDISGIKREMIEGDLLYYDRHKTGAQRIVPLWPETISALKRLKTDEGGYLFNNGNGARLVTDDRDTLGDWFNELCADAKIRNLGFYSIRRTFRTVVDELPDRRAVDIVTGHVQRDIASVYVQHIDPERLRTVTAHVRSWFFSQAEETEKASQAASSRHRQPSRRSATRDSSDKRRRAVAQE